MNKIETDIKPLQTKQHFEILDGLRGLAAISVVVFHFMEFIQPQYENSFIAHGYLAVDFFFCLSGFVIAYAYDQRIAKIGVVQFIKLRLIRLHPLVIIGAIIGIFAFILDPFSNLYATYGLGKTMLMFVSSCLMIPYPIVHERYLNLFHLNPPTWSLFWEYIANIFYALILFRLRNKVLWVLVTIAAALLCYTAYKEKYLGVGFGGDNFWGGAARIFFSFLAGMLVFRSNWVIKSKLGFITIGILLLISFLVPYSTRLNMLTEPLIIIFYFPLIVALGAGAQLVPQFKKLCNFSGNISYPLYMIHYPLLWIYYSYVLSKKPSLTEMTVEMVIGTIMLIGAAYLTMVLLDFPIRKYFTNKIRSARA